MSSGRKSKTKNNTQLCLWDYIFRVLLLLGNNAIMKCLDWLTFLQVGGVALMPEWSIDSNALLPFIVINTIHFSCPSSQ